MENYNN